MEAAKIFEGIALLIELAQRGEIDPWDVQVIDVIDRYLSKLVPAEEATQAAREADLSQSGQAFLSASMLVLFKANTLVELEAHEAELNSSEDNFLPEVEDGAPTKLRLPLENQLRRRPAALPPQKRRVTLQELIDQLHVMAAQLQSQEANALSNKSTRTRRFDSQSRAQVARATLELAHQENLTEVAGELEQVLNSHSHRILKRNQDWLNLDQLVDLWMKQTQLTSAASSTQHDRFLPHGSLGSQEAGDLLLCSTSISSHLPPQAYDRVSVFWALLLLSAQSKVELAQEEFYQDIKIRTLEIE